jgi:hypothetical protein
MNLKYLQGVLLIGLLFLTMQEASSTETEEEKENYIPETHQVQAPKGAPKSVAITRITPVSPRFHPGCHLDHHWEANVSLRQYLNPFLNLHFELPQDFNPSRNPLTGRALLNEEKKLPQAPQYFGDQSNTQMTHFFNDPDPYPRSNIFEDLLSSPLFFLMLENPDLQMEDLLNPIVLNFLIKNSNSSRNYRPAPFENYRSQQIAEYCMTVPYEEEDHDIYDRDYLKVLVEYLPKEGEALITEERLFTGKGLKNFLDNSDNEASLIQVVKIYEDLEELENEN